MLLVATIGCDEGDAPAEKASDGSDDTVRTAPGDTTAAAAADTSAGLLDPAIPLETEAGGPARFAFRSGHVEMRYEGLVSGVRTIDFDDYGLRERTYDSAVPSGTQTQLIPPFALTIFTKEWYGAVDLRTKKGKKGANDTYRTYETAWRAEKRPLGEIIMDRSGAERLADTTLLGRYRCRVYRMRSSGYMRTLWLFGGVPIRESVTLGGDAGGSYTVEPVAIETNIAIDPALFTFSDDYTLTDAAADTGR